MTSDIIEKVGKGSLIQHGPLNNRIYLMKLHPEDYHEIIGILDTLAKAEGYTKLFCKVPLWASPVFQAYGFFSEAQIPNFFNGKEGVAFMSKFLNSNRLFNIENDKLYEFSEILQTGNGEAQNISLPDGISLVKITENDVEEVTKVYKQVFESYPFPIFDTAYIVETMKQNVFYYGLRQGEKLVAVSSAEVDAASENAEMTDFAVLPEYRGKKFAIILLAHMEKVMQKQGVKTLYTIARLNSLPMNKTFLKLGYKYSGSLIMNTNIAGKIETMNVLYKHI